MYCFVSLSEGYSFVGGNNFNYSLTIWKILHVPTVHTVLLHNKTNIISVVQQNLSLCTPQPVVGPPWWRTWVHPQDLSVLWADLTLWRGSGRGRSASTSLVTCTVALLSSPLIGSSQQHTASARKGQSLSSWLTTSCYCDMITVMVVVCKNYRFRPTVTDIAALPVLFGFWALKTIYLQTPVTGYVWTWAVSSAAKECVFPLFEWISESWICKSLHYCARK